MIGSVMYMPRSRLAATWLRKSPRCSEILSSLRLQILQALKYFNHFETISDTADLGLGESWTNLHRWTLPMEPKSQGHPSSLAGPVFRICLVTFVKYGVTTW